MTDFSKLRAGDAVLLKDYNSDTGRTVRVTLLIRNEFIRIDRKGYDAFLQSDGLMYGAEDGYPRIEIPTDTTTTTPPNPTKEANERIVADNLPRLTGEQRLYLMKTVPAEAIGAMALQVVAMVGENEGKEREDSGRQT